MATSHTKAMDSLLRGEISAIETYQQALAKLDHTRGESELRRLHAEHRDAANTLRKHIHEHGEQPSTKSGVWGTFAKLVTGTAKAFGPKSALKALKEGEEHGVKEYEAAIKDKTCPEDCRTLITAQLLPQTQAHVRVLDRLMAGMVERITPQEARQHMTEHGALLVCAYDSDEKYRQACLAGAISLNEFKNLAKTWPKEREIIFYCG